MGFHVTPFLRSAFGISPDSDNRLNFTGYVNRYGYPAAPGCTPGTIDCLLASVSGVPAEIEQFQYRGDEYMEMDLYFGGQPSGWIIPPFLRPGGH